MTGVKHAFTSGKADDADATLVNPSDWNDEHEPNLTTKGDSIFRGASAAARLPVGSNGHGLVGDSAESLGVKYIPVVSILDRDLTQVEVVNTVSETSLYSHSIPANKLGATGGIRLTIGGDYLNNDGAARTLGIKIKLGATTVLIGGPTGLTNNSNRRKWKIIVWCMNTSTSAQKWNALIIISHPSTGDFAFGMTAAVGDVLPGAGHGVSSEDTTGALTLEVTAVHGVAAATVSIRKEEAFLELLPAI